MNIAMLRFLIISIPLLITLSCSSEVTSPDTIQVNLNEPVELNFGQSLVLADEELEITFFDVPEDSRCAEDVKCVWAGNAVIQLKVIEKNREMSWKLNTHSDIPNEVNSDFYFVKLLSVKPVPNTQKEIKKDDYVITLFIEKK